MNPKKEEIIRELKSGKVIIDGHTHVGISTRAYLDYAYPYGMSFEDLIIRMKLLGIDKAIVFPHVDSLYYNLKTAEPEKVEPGKDLCSFPYEVENTNLFNEIYEIFPEYSDMALPFAIFDPSRNVREQVAFLEDIYARYPMFGLKTCTTYTHSFVNDLEGTGAAVLEFARKYSLPITFHSSYYREDPWARLADILKIAQTYPDINVCLAHSARLCKSALDEADSLENCFVDLSAFKIHCDLAKADSEIVAPAQERFEADYNKPEQVMRKLVETYPQTIIWGTDIPANYFIRKHYNPDGTCINFSLRSSFDMEVKILKTLPRDYISKIAYENMLKYLFG